jgi:hypothetical protein
MNEVALGQYVPLSFNFSPIPGLVSVPAAQSGVGVQRFSLEDDHLKLPKTFGVYRITFQRGWFYIGSTSAPGGFAKRIWQHMYDLINNRHGNGWMQNVFNKYGFCDAYVEIIEEAEGQKTKDLEQVHINENYNNHKCINICRYVSGYVRGDKKNTKPKTKNKVKREWWILRSFNGAFKSKDEALGKIKAMYDLGMSFSEIANSLSATFAVVNRIYASKYKPRSSGESTKLKRARLASSDEFIAMVRRASESGMSISQASPALKISRKRLIGLSKIHNIRFGFGNQGKKSKIKTVDSVRIKLCRDMITSGHTLRDIATRLGFATGTCVGSFLKRNGINKPKPSISKLKLAASWGGLENYSNAVRVAKEIISSGGSLLALANALGVGKNKAWGLLKREGIKQDRRNISKTNRIA